MKKHFWLGLILVVLLSGAAVFYGYHEWHAHGLSARDELLSLMPADAQAILFLDLNELRTASFFAKLYAWAPKPEVDPEYAQFLRDTGFDYERDLARIVIAQEKRGQDLMLFAVADGKFDQSKISSLAARTGTVLKTGRRDIFLVPVTGSVKNVSFTFLRGDRIALTDGPDLAGILASKKRETDAAEWRTRFERLAGSPVFAVIRQDAAAGAALAQQAPGGLRSPQLSTLLDQLQWITIAAKPDNDSLRVIAEGESASESTTRQLADVLNGIVLLADAGLNDAKTRQQLDPALRSAYLELLKSADVSRINRGDTKSVRLAFEITPAFLEAGTRPPGASPRAGSPKPAPGTATRSKKGHT